MYAFGNKSVADIFQEVYNSQQKTNDNIDEIMEQIRTYVTSLNDATIISPILRDFLETNIKNNQVLLKITEIVQKAYERHEKEKLENPNSNFMFSEDEVAELRKASKFQMKAS